MVDSTITAAGWKRPAATDRHPPKRPVALPLCRFGAHRPSSTVRIHPTPPTAKSTISARGVQRAQQLVDWDTRAHHVRPDLVPQRLGSERGLGKVERDEVHRLVVAQA